MMGAGKGSPAGLFVFLFSFLWRNQSADRLEGEGFDGASGPTCHYRIMGMQ